MIKKKGLLTLVVGALLVVAYIFTLTTAVNKSNDAHKLKQENEVLLNENQSMKDSIQSSTEKIMEYETKIEEMQTEIETLKKKVAEKASYPDTELTQAEFVWRRLKKMGLNDYVAAGIMGNMMAEVGGNTLDLSLYSTKESNGYYGLCQWGGSRKDRLYSSFGKSIEAQMNFLEVELYEVFSPSSSFFSLTNEKEAALQFAKYYERCSSATYEVRKSNATTALKYFTGVQ